MSIFKRLIGMLRAPASHDHSQLASGHSQSAIDPAASQTGTRRELLRVVLRDTLQRHGIPGAWISAETLLATSRHREPGLHWRLHIRHWEPRLLPHAVAIQHALINGVLSFDPMAADWLLGISWQFALDDESACPALPHAGMWTADPGAAAPTPAKLVPVDAAKAGLESPAPGSTRADLEKLFAVRDADLQRHAEVAEPTPDFERTQPMFAVTEPHRL